MYTYKCEICGANLDPQEVCEECRAKLKSTEKRKDYLSGMLVFENNGQLRLATTFTKK